MIQPAAEREAWVQNACGADFALVQELLERLRWQDRMGDFLLEPRVTFDVSVTGGDREELRYRVLNDAAINKSALSRIIAKGAKAAVAEV